MRRASVRDMERGVEQRGRGWPGWPPAMRAVEKGVEYTRRARLDGNFSLILLNYVGLPRGALLRGQVLFL